MVHDDCRGHQESKDELGARNDCPGLFMETKISTKSSTTVELVGVDDLLGCILWARYFMQEQGFDIEVLLLYQHNMSAMLLEMNGRASSLKCTKHIKVKYFLLTIRSTKVGAALIKIKEKIFLQI